MLELLCLAVLVALCALYTTNYLSRKSWNTTPTPFEFPLLGNVPQLLYHWNDLHDWLVEVSRAFPDKFSFWIPSRGTFMVCLKPDDVKHFLHSNFDNYGKGQDFHSSFHELLGDGIFSVDGQDWKMQRKTAARIFNVKNFKDNMCEVFKERAFAVASVIESKQDGIVDFSDLMHKYTLDSFGAIAFGINMDCVRKDRVPFALAFDQIQETLNSRFFIPFWQMFKYVRPAEFQLRKNEQIINKFAYSVIKSRRTDPKLNERGDLLSLFMRDDIMQKYDTEEQQNEFLRDIVMNFIIAGRDTTAQALSWMFYLLAKHPEIQKKVLEEVDSLNGEYPTYESLKNMKYLHATFSETLRLYPSVPKDAKVAFDDDVLPDGTKVKKGTWMVFLPYAMGRQESLWGKDAGEFNPERWFQKDFSGPSESDEQTLLAQSLLQVSPFKFTAFQAGPRICLGQNMAYIEAKLVSCALLQKFTFELDPSTHVRYRNTATLPMKYGMKMKAIKRFH